ncbi:glycine-rich domain-containing protein [Chitinimonas lacunae]|uniref:Glycine-rich domain-containing protein n=1 Tax=Chitinimonas lacunae TaxID=1963018 RepID=A0ABV8MP50_9NEIS
MSIWIVGGMFFGAIAVSYLALRVEQRRRQYLASAPLPKGLIERVKPKHPHLTAAQWHDVEAGLRQFFLFNLQAKGHLVAMPSQVVDDLWHEFILYTRNYQEFCRQGFGRLLHHTPAVAMTHDDQQRHGLRRAWYLSCAYEGIDPKQPSRLPKLFALDASLAIVGGFVYQPDCQAAGQSGVYCGSDLSSCSGGCGGDGGDGCGGGCGGD